MTSLPDLDATALELITEFGGYGTYESSTQPVYNPATSTVTSTPMTQPVKMCLLDLTLQSNGLSLRYGTEIIAGDKEGYILPPQKSGGTPVTIQPGKDRVTFGGVVYTVVTFKEINPTGLDPVVYFVYLRR